MKWKRDHRSENVDDRRGATTQGSSAGGAGIILFLFRTFGIKGALAGIVVVGGIALLGGGDMLGVSAGTSQPAPSSPKDDADKAFVSFVLDDVQATWKRLRPNYQLARLVLFSGQTRSSCGLGKAATGPFYCPADQHVYIDLSFYDSLKQRLGAPGDFAQAYVIAHEIGHHLTKLDGNLAKGRGKGANSGSVRVELQADCYAGVWAHSAKKRELLEVGDFEEAMRAAEAIGDDTLQKSAGGAVRPESFSHGTSAQRMRWFKRGFDLGDPATCNTFESRQL